MSEKAKKLTKKDKFNILLNIPEVAENEEMVQFINHEIELLEKKNASTGEKKMTATQIINTNIKNDIVDYMSLEPDRLFTISELMKLVPSCDGLSNQRVNQLVRQLYEPLGDKVERIEQKGKALFRILPQE